MRKRRILAMLLAVCMIVQSTVVAFASETDPLSADKAALETETPTENPMPGSGEQTPPAVDGAADSETGSPEEVAPGEALPEETPEKPEDGAGEGQIPGDGTEQPPAEGTEQPPVEGTEQPPVEDPDGETEQDPDAAENPADATEELVPEEEDPDGASQVMSETEPLADGEITQGGKSWTVNLTLRQEYGMVELNWTTKDESTSSMGSRQYYKIYRAESADGPWNEDALLTKVEDVDILSYEDTDVREAGKATNKTYYYRVSVVYDEHEEGTSNWPLYESVLSDSKTNKDSYYYASGYPYPGAELDYTGVYVTDDKGTQLNELNIKEGEPTSLRLYGIKADGSGAVELSGAYNTGWYLCTQYYTGQEISDGTSSGEATLSRLGDDKIQLVPEMNLKEGTMNDCHVTMTALSGAARSDTYYLIMNMTHSHVGHFVWQIPVHIEEGDGDITPPAVEGLYTTKEALCQAMRDTMVSREDAVLYATGGYEWWNTSSNPARPDLDFEDVFDFHREREGMKPCEGDYLSLAMGDASSEVYSGTWMEMKDSTLAWGGQYLKQYTITPSFITTRAQEEEVDQKINDLIRKEGGALYNYQSASDYAKVKAAYDYVRGHVSYISSKTPIYHTCYSALIKGKATCQGYALLFYRLVRELGIPCRVLMGTDANAHTYDIVQMDDGSWYYVDTNAGVLLKGTNDFKPAQLQSQYLTPAFKAEYISKIPKTSYAGAETEVSKLTAASLAAEEIQAIDANLTAAAADRMKADYTINGAAVKASGTVKYLEGCSKYLGYEESQSMPTSGYFLALKLSVDAEKFTENGKLTVSYSDVKKERQEKAYTKADLTSGAVNLLVNVSENPGMKIRVDYDGDGETSKYDEMVYDLDLSGLKKESRTESSGTIKEVNKYGIELSAPIVKKSDDGKTIAATYEAVAYSDQVKWTESAEQRKGNYIALRMEMPESVKVTEMAKALMVTAEDGAARAAQTLTAGWNEAPGCYMEAAENNSELFLAMPVTKGFNKRFTVRWGGENPLAFKQTLTVSVPAESALEVRSENALLPGSLAFNGLVSTMYVGQSQNVHITFKKKYEQDEIQVYYTTDNADVVAVNRITGVLKALKPGTANITVSAVDKSGSVITKTARITVKELPAPAGVKTSLVRDHEVTVGWKANTTGQYTEAYAIPYRLTTFGSSAKQWKHVVENAMNEAGMDATAFATLSDSDKSAKLAELANFLGTGSWSAAAVPAKDNSVTLTGLQPETEYVLYVRNVSETAASTFVFSGVTSGKVKTTKPVFDKIRLQLKNENGDVLKESKPGSEPVVVYEVTDTETPITFSYQLLDKDGTKMDPDTEFKNIKYTSGNAGIVKVDAPKNAPAALKFGSQVGETVIMMTGKDASGMLRPSEQLRIRVVKAPGQLKDKSTTLTIGQSVPIKELIGTDLKGTAAGLNLDTVDFASALQVITDSEYFAVTYPAADDQAAQNPKDAIITAKALIEGKSGNKIEVPFKMGDSSATAKIQIKDMQAVSIGKITVRDTSAQIEFKPSQAVTKIEAAAGTIRCTLRIRLRV